MKIFCIVILSVFLFAVSHLGICLETDEIISLKQAGVSDLTIQLMVKEKSKETCSFTVQEIVSLKNAGVNEKTIQILIVEGSFIKNTDPMIYGNDFKPLRFTSAKDIIELKNAGLSDEVIQAIIIFGARDENDIERQKSWELLNNMGIIIDKRKNR